MNCDLSLVVLAVRGDVGEPGLSFFGEEIRYMMSQAAGGVWSHNTILVGILTYYPEYTLCFTYYFKYMLHCCHMTYYLGY